jgi:N-acylglucosamine 2-epimerase
MPPNPPARDTPPAEPAGWRDLVTTYRPQARRALAESILPFWWRTIDGERGGVFNCWNNPGTRLESRDKFTWSQGRFAWLWSRLAGVTAVGRLPGDPARYLAQAEKTVKFLRQHALLDDGRCAFLLSEDGVVKEAVPGQGPAPSIYADCFVAMGFAEYARVSGDRAVFDAAWALFEQIGRRLTAGVFPTHPYPIPEGYSSHAITMIHLNVTLVLHDAAEGLQDARAPELHARTVAAAARIFDGFMEPDGRIAELRPRGSGDDDSLLARHINPGHALEGLWMLMTVAAREGRGDWLARAGGAVQFALERGWDAAHGGLLQYVDRDGGQPRGTAGDSAYEAGVRASWDSKLWWVHSESLYATLLWYRFTGYEGARGWFEKVWEYSFRVFPNPDAEVGEWIQIRDRHGMPIDRVVALPVKDPYHLARNLVQVLEAF